MDANKAMVVEDIAMDVFMSGPFLQWVSACNFFLQKIWQTFEDLKTNSRLEVSWNDVIVLY